jgi:hypothetical protein
VAFSTFTVTEVTYNFTATVTTPLELALVGNDTTVVVTDQTSNIVVNNLRQPITVSGFAGATYNQGLNTGDNVSFASVTTPAIYGFAGQPVQFPTGISVDNFGTVFSGSLDFGAIFGTYTNILSLLFAAIPIDMGTIVSQPQYQLDMGTI